MAVLIHSTTSTVQAVWAIPAIDLGTHEGRYVLPEQVEEKSCSPMAQDDTLEDLVFLEVSLAALVGVV